MTNNNSNITVYIGTNGHLSIDCIILTLASISILVSLGITLLKLRQFFLFKHLVNNIVGVLIFILSSTVIHIGVMYGKYLTDTECIFLSCAETFSLHLIVYNLTVLVYHSKHHLQKKMEIIQILISWCVALISTAIIGGLLITPNRKELDSHYNFSNNLCFPASYRHSHIGNILFGTLICIPGLFLLIFRGQIVSNLSQNIQGNEGTVVKQKIRSQISSEISRGKRVKHYPNWMPTTSDLSERNKTANRNGKYLEGTKQNASYSKDNLQKLPSSKINNEDISCRKESRSFSISSPSCRGSSEQNEQEKELRHKESNHIKTIATIELEDLQPARRVEIDNEAYNEMEDNSRSCHKKLSPDSQSLNTIKHFQECGLILGNMVFKENEKRSSKSCNSQYNMRPKSYAMCFTLNALVTFIPLIPILMANLTSLQCSSCKPDERTWHVLRSIMSLLGVLTPSLYIIAIQYLSRV